MTKFNYSDVEKIVTEKGYILFETYINSKGKRKIIFLDVDQYKYSMTLNDFINQGVRFVTESNPFSLENIENWIKLNNKKYRLCYEQIYKGKSSPLSFMCLLCNENFEMSWNSIRNGRCCPYCSGRKVGRYNNLSHLRPDLVNEWHHINDIKPEDVTEFSNKKVYWLCSICSFVWKCSVASRSSGDKTGCPNCASSKGEKRINNFLKEKGISFITQAKIGCKNKRELPFDFYLIDYDLLIEYDGILHYEDKFNNPKEFKRLLENDYIKNEYCLKNNIKLLRIPYWSFENIEKIIIKELNLPD